MTKHKILSEIGLKDEEMVVNLSEEDESRTADWEHQREEYGFDERETWAMDMAFAEWLVERLVMYKKVSIVDTTFHKFDINGEILTQEECIDKMISLCKEYIFADTWGDDSATIWHELTEIWKVCGMAMWW